MIFRTVVVVSLFIIFIVFFGYPAYKRYQSGGVLVEEDEEHVDLITPPAITVCPRNPQSRFKLGWKDSSRLFDVERGPCEGSSNAEELVACVEKKVYTKEEIFMSQYGVWKAGNKVGLSQWKGSFWPLFFGKCFSLKAEDGTIGFTLYDGLSISLNSSLEYWVILHDPDYFVMSSNPTTIPRIAFSIDKNFGSKTVYIEATKHKKMDRKKRPCVEELDYSFTYCVRLSIATRIGCNSLWDSFPGLQPCTSLSQVKSYENQYNNLG